MELMYFWRTLFVNILLADRILRCEMDVSGSELFYSRAFILAAFRFCTQLLQCLLAECYSI
jgi:hypothetical protein